MERKEQILDLYFNKHLQQAEISKQLQVSQQYISKIVKKDERLKTEKDYRKSQNAEKRKVYQKEYQKNYVRKYDKNRNQYIMLKGIKASIDLPRRIKASIY